MNKRNVFVVLAVLLVVFIAGGIGLAKDSGDQIYTGCLNRGGQIKNVAVGDQPLKACGANETQISWNQKGPQGLPGRNGLYASGLVGSSRIEDCVTPYDDKLQCPEKLAVSFEVNEGQPVILTFNGGDTSLYAEKFVPPSEKGCKDDLLKSGAYQVCITIKDDGNTFILGLSPAFPVRQFDKDNRCTLLKDTLVKCTLHAEKIRESIVKAHFGFVDLFFAPYAAGANEVELHVTVANEKGERASAIVSAPDCDFDLDPMAAQSVLLKKGEKDELVFNLRTDGSLVEGDKCRIWLLSPTGRIFEETGVAIPAPEKS